MPRSDDITVEQSARLRRALAGARALLESPYPEDGSVVVVRDEGFVIPASTGETFTSRSVCRVDDVLEP